MRVIKANLLARRDTTANWNDFVGFIPLKGEIIVYTDRYTNDKGRLVPGVKIGDGTTYCVDLPFISSSDGEEILEKLNKHIENTNIHVSEDDRERWDDKTAVDFSCEQEELIIKNL